MGRNPNIESKNLFALMSTNKLKSQRIANVSLTLLEKESKYTFI